MRNASWWRRLIAPCSGWATPRDEPRSVDAFNLWISPQRLAEQIAVGQRICFGLTFKAQTEDRLCIAGTQQAPSAFKLNADAIHVHHLALVGQRLRHPRDDTFLVLIRAVRAI